jgi:hypothetical protein
VNGIERRYEHIPVPPAAPRGASKRAAAVQAAYVILVNRFPAQTEDLNAKRAASLAAIGDVDGKSLQRGIEWGQTVADAILLWRSTDGYDTPLPPYFGSEESGKWRPTGVNATTGLPVPGVLPQLAITTPWGIPSPDSFRPAGPPPLGSAKYLADLEEVRAIGSVDSPLRTDDETAACLFAAPTSGTYVWNRVAIDLAKEHQFELSENAKLLASLNLSQADAVITCWDAKYAYEFWRPITAIRLLDEDGDGTPDDPNWTPLISTPPHPEYSSGHSSVYASAATVLAAYFGDNTPIVLEDQADTSWTRSYPSFSAALDEVAVARVFGGIHFRSACDDAVATSTAVAMYILQNRMQRLHGKGKPE